MKTIKTADLANDINEVCDWLEQNKQEWVIISSPRNKNMVIMTEEEANSLAKIGRNADYLAKLDKGTEAIKNNDLIHVSFEELKAMED